MPAIALYEKLGFETVRDVEIWTLERRVSRQHDVRSVPREQAQARIARERRQREPWQRADESVAHYEGVEGLESGRGAILSSATASASPSSRASPPTRRARAS